MIVSSTCPVETSCLLAYLVAEWIRFHSLVLIWIQAPLVGTPFLLSTSTYEGFGPFLESLSDNSFQHGVFNIYVYVFLSFQCSFLVPKCLHFYVSSLKLNYDVVDYFLNPEAFSYLNTLVTVESRLCYAVHHLSSVLYLCQEVIT